MSCNQGTAGDVGPSPEPDGGGGSVGFLAVLPNKFTRKELQAMLKKTRDLLAYDVPTVRDIEREFLECMADDLDMLDALMAREETDLAELEETIKEHSQPSGITITDMPPCPCHPRLYGHGVGD